MELEVDKVYHNTHVKSDVKVIMVDKENDTVIFDILDESQKSRFGCSALYKGMYPFMLSTEVKRMTLTE